MRQVLGGAGAFIQMALMHQQALGKNGGVMRIGLYHTVIQERNGRVIRAAFAASEEGSGLLMIIGAPYQQQEAEQERRAGKLEGKSQGQGWVVIKSLLGAKPRNRRPSKSPVFPAAWA
ncbi:hypothetical protein GCM10011405_00610 [Rufibacter glacialis]|nr:hypothetical protein GCM10011405_00610 [Rufibacter glacialis]